MKKYFAAISMFVLRVVAAVVVAVSFMFFCLWFVAQVLQHYAGI